MTDPTQPLPVDPAQPDRPPPGLSDPDVGEEDPGGDEHRGLMDRLRHSGVGVEDPNIVGDAGPTDVAPGHDPDTDESGLLVADPDPDDIPTEDEVPG